MQTLLEKDFAINSPIDDGKGARITLLKLAIEQGDQPFAKFLMENGAHPDVHDQSSWVISEMKNQNRGPGFDFFVPEKTIPVAARVPAPAPLEIVIQAEPIDDANDSNCLSTFGNGAADCLSTFGNGAADCVSACGSGLATTGAIVGSAVLSGVVIGGLEAGMSALAGYAGSSILQHYYESYDVAEAVHMGAVGGAVIGGGLGVLIGSCVAPIVVSGSRGNSNDSSSGSSGSRGSSVLGAVGATVLNGLAGYGLMNMGSSKTAMNLGQTAALFAVGAGAISAGAVAAVVGVVCVVAPIACCCSCLSPQREQPRNIYTV